MADEEEVWLQAHDLLHHDLRVPLLLLHQPATRQAQYLTTYREKAFKQLSEKLSDHHHHHHHHHRERERERERERAQTRGRILQKLDRRSTGRLYTGVSKVANLVKVRWNSIPPDMSKILGLRHLRVRDFHKAFFHTKRERERLFPSLFFSPGGRGTRAP